MWEVLSQADCWEAHTRRPTIRNACAGEEALAWPHNLLLVPQKDPKARGLSRDQDVSSLQWPLLSVTAWLQAPTDMHPFHMQNACTLSNTQSPETQLELDASIGKRLKSGLPAAFQAGSSRAKCWVCKCEPGCAPITTHQATALRREGKQMWRAFCLQGSGDQVCAGHTSHFLISLLYFLPSNDQM